MVTKTIKMILPVIPSILIALILMMVARQFILPNFAEEDLSIIGAFLEIFGVIYAIIIGFLFIRVLNRFYEISHTIQNGLTAITNIRDFLIYFNENEKEKRNVIKCLYDYVNSVVQYEWLEMEYMHKRTISSDTSPELYNLMQAVNQIKIKTRRDAVALGDIIDKIGDLTGYRARRLVLSDEKMAPMSKILIIFMSATLIIGTAFLGVESVWAHSLLIAIIVFIVQLLYTIIRELDHPFVGYFNVKVQPFRDVRDKLEMELKASE